METTDYVSYPVALALKKAGFDWPCDHYYNGHGNLNRYADTDRINRNTNGHHTPSCSAPHIYYAQKWLREKRRFDIEIRVWLVGIEQEYRPYIMPPKCKDYIAYPPEKSYEQAFSTGIEAVLELIEKKGE